MAAIAPRLEPLSALEVFDHNAVVCRLEHVRQVEFHVFVDQEGDAGRWDDSNEVRSESAKSLSVHHIVSHMDHGSWTGIYTPSVESHGTLVLPDLFDYIHRTSVPCLRIVGLQTRTHDLVRICDAPREDLAYSAQVEVIDVSQTLRSVGPPRAPAVLQLLVRHELDGTVADAEERRQEPPIKALDALRLVQIVRAVRDGAVRARRVARRRQHARLDHPDGVCEDGGDDAAGARGDEVVAGAQLLVLVPSHRRDPVLDVGVPHEIHPPADAVANHVRHQAAVETAQDLRRILCDAIAVQTFVRDLTHYTQGAAGADFGILFDLQAGLHHVEGVDGEGRDDAGGETGRRLYQGGGDVDGRLTAFERGVDPRHHCGGGGGRNGDVVGGDVFILDLFTAAWSESADRLLGVIVVFR